jgi:hypothetical protein
VQNWNEQKFSYRSESKQKKRRNGGTDANRKLDSCELRVNLRLGGQSDSQDGARVRRLALFRPNGLGLLGTDGRALPLLEAIEYKLDAG